MSIQRYRGLLAVILWQTVPSPVAFDSTGRIQGAFGFGGGQYEQVRVSCDGEDLGSSGVAFRGGGAQLDAWPNRSVRLTGFGGALRADSANWDGAYIGGMGALELQRIGVGAGVVQTPDEVWPSLYLRLGNRDKLHMHSDFSAPSPPLNASGAARIGLGYKQGHLRGVGGVGGLALCHARCDGNSRAAIFADLHVPVGSRFDLELRALAGSGKEHENTGFAAGGRIHFGN